MSTSKEVRFAPTLALPFIEIKLPPSAVGSGTQYPFGTYDLSNMDSQRKFLTLFECLTARIIRWTLGCNITYTSVEDGTINHIGSATHLAQGIRRGIHAEAPGTLRPDGSAASEPPKGLWLQNEPASGPVVTFWNNPHGTDFDPQQAYSTIYDDAFATRMAQFNTDIVNGDPPDEEAFSMPDFLLSSGAVTSDTPTGDFSSAYSLLYNTNGFNDSDIFGTPPPYRHFYAHTFRSMLVGYPALLVHLGFGDFVHSPIPRFEVSTHAGSLPVEPFAPAGTLVGGPVGTFTLTLPDPLTGTNHAYTAPLSGWYPPGKTGVSFTCDITMDVALALSYAGRFATNGTKLKNPLN